MTEALLPLTDDRGEGAFWKERTETEPLTPTKNTAAALIAITTACGTPAPSDKSAFVRLPTMPNTPATALAGDAVEVMTMLAAGDPATVMAGADELPRQARPPPRAVSAAHRSAGGAGERGSGFKRSRHAGRRGRGRRGATPCRQPQPTCARSS